MAVNSDTVKERDSSMLPMPSLDMRTVSHQAVEYTNRGGVVVPGRPDAQDIPDPEDALDTVPSATVQSPQDTLQELAKHYLEALYLSRTSLAYFTKGALSRARAAASSSSKADSNAEGRITIADLVDFLRQSILASVTMDKKYRDAITGMIKEFPVISPTDDSPKAPKKRKKRKWKPKRDKNGFFVDEQELVERWWQETDHDEFPGTETADTVLRKRLARIRNRETFLLIILCLEVLALEASLSTEDQKRQETTRLDLELQGAGETQQDDTQATSAGATKPAKSKKKQNLTALLETLLDKLTIWYSLESHSPLKARQGTNSTDNDQPRENDELRNFCVEVIMPFYISRIPQHANAVNKKLGGPSAPSPVKRKSSSKSTKEPPRKPGEPALRQPPPERKPRQPLTRVSSEIERPPSKSRHSMPSLHRSSTDTDALLTRIKRETSESVPPMESIPAAKATVKPQRGPRASLMSSLSRREVDLTAMSAASEAKLKKKADVEEKLREAISTLKKPNRAAAVKEVAESADASFAKALARGKGQQPKGKAAGTGAAARKEDKAWLIAATPSKHARSAKSIKATPYHGQQSTLSANEADALPSSGSSALVPSSSARLKAEPRPQNDLSASTSAIPVTGHRPRYHYLQPPKALNAVEETPSRGFARFMPAGLAREPGTLESPIASRKAAVEQTPSKPFKSITSTLPGISSTPLRPPEQPQAAGPLMEASPNCAGAGHKEDCAYEAEENSIYAALGWDDEGYDQLA
jgi:hypothetical protein